MAQIPGLRAYTWALSILLTSLLLPQLSHAQKTADRMPPRTPLDPPRTKEECDELHVGVMVSLSDMPVLQRVQAMKDTQVHVLLPEMCKRGQFYDAWAISQQFLDKPEKGPPATVADCEDRATENGWTIFSSAGGYRLVLHGRYVSKAGSMFAGVPTIAVSGRPADATRRIEIIAGTDLKPLAMVDVEIVANDREQPISGRAPVHLDRFVDISALVPNFAQTTSLRVAVKSGGQEMFTVAFDIPYVGRAEFKGSVMAGDLAAKRSAGACRDKCFLTTACCEVMGRPDDCFELRALRQFRDNVMMPHPEGRVQVALYYALAPVILRELRRQGGERSLLGCYFTHILPCVIGTRLGLHQLVLAHYQRLIHGLCQKWAPELVPLVDRVQGYGEDVCRNSWRLPSHASWRASSIFPGATSHQ